MLPGEKILLSYKKDGKITEEECNELIEKCAGIKDFFKTLGGIKQAIKDTEAMRTAGKSMDPSHGGKIERTFAGKKPGVIKDALLQPAVIGSMATIAAGGAIGAGLSAIDKRRLKKETERNYQNLIMSNPGLIKDKDLRKARRVVFELTSMAPLAATNDNILKNYVLKGLKGKTTLEEMSHASNIRGRKSRHSLTKGMFDPPPVAKEIGNIASAQRNRDPHDIAFGTFRPEARQSATLNAVFAAAYPRKSQELIKVYRSTAQADPQFAKKMEFASGGILPENRWKGMTKRSSIYNLKKTASGKFTPLWKLINKSYPYVAGGMGVGAGIGTAAAAIEAIKVNKENKMILDTFNKLKKNSDFKGKEKQLTMAFETLTKFAPSMATSPQTSMAFLRSTLLDYPDPITGDPLIGPEHIKLLTDVQKNYEVRDISPISTGFKTGFTGSLKGTIDASKTLSRLD